MPRQKSSRHRASPPPADDLPRLRALYRAAISAGGNLQKMRQVLGVSAQAVAQRLSLLRRLGVARTITLHDPLALSTIYQSMALVRMADLTSEAIDRFERLLREDAHIASAQLITGDCDYRLSCFHESYVQAARWGAEMRCRPEVAEVRQMPLLQLFGHELPGVVLWGGKRFLARSEANSRADAPES